MTIFKVIAKKTKFGLDDKSGNDSQSQAAEMSWVTMSDVKLQAVKG